MGGGVRRLSVEGELATSSDDSNLSLGTRPFFSLNPSYVGCKLIFPNANMLGWLRNDLSQPTESLRYRLCSPALN